MRFTGLLFVLAATAFPGLAEAMPVDVVSAPSALLLEPQGTPGTFTLFTGRTGI
jgi:hypothetical protein